MKIVKISNPQLKFKNQSCQNQQISNKTNILTKETYKSIYSTPGLNPAFGSIPQKPPLTKETKETLNEFGTVIKRDEYLNSELVKSDEFDDEGRLAKRTIPHYMEPGSLESQTIIHKYRNGIIKQTLILDENNKVESIYTYKHKDGKVFKKEFYGNTFALKARTVMSEDDEDFLFEEQHFFKNGQIHFDIKYKENGYSIESISSFTKDGTPYHSLIEYRNGLCEKKDVSPDAFILDNQN